MILGCDSGFLGVSISAEFSDSKKTVQNEILTFNRFLEDANTSDELIVPLIPTPMVSTNATEIPTALPDQPVDLSVLNDDNVATSALVRNIVGLVIIIVVLVVTAILLVRRRTPKTQK